MNKRYCSIDGLRAISCLLIIAMHILYNTEYSIDGFVYNTMIPSFTWLVYLFIMISGFGMCAGYLEKFQHNEVDLEAFYKRRYKKILPFFAFLICIALIVEPSLNNFYEASIEVTLLHGLLPNNNLNVLGVCWTLGVIFLFYLLFPAFTVLMKSKKRAWCAFAVSIWINVICRIYFFNDSFVTDSFTPRHSFIYCIPLFICGGLVYLYRKEVADICRRFRWIVLALCLICSVAYYALPHTVHGFDITYYLLLLIYTFWLCYSVGVDSKFLGSKVMKYLGGISMEMYLSQMVIFRVVEKFNMLYLFGKGWLSYIMTFIFTVLGIIAFVEIYKVMTKLLVSGFKKLKIKTNCRRKQ